MFDADCRVFFREARYSSMLSASLPVPSSSLLKKALKVVFHWRDKSLVLNSLLSES